MPAGKTFHTHQRGDIVVKARYRILMLAEVLSLPDMASLAVSFSVLTTAPASPKEPKQPHLGLAHAAGHRALHIHKPAIILPQRQLCQSALACTMQENKYVTAIRE